MGTGGALHPPGPGVLSRRSGRDHPGCGNLHQLATPRLRPRLRTTMHEDPLLQRTTVNPGIFGGKPIIRGRRLAVEHVLAIRATPATPKPFSGLNDHEPR